MPPARPRSQARGDARGQFGVERRISPAGRAALEKIIEDPTAEVGRHLEPLDAGDAGDRRNGFYRRHLLKESGHIELNAPRTRRYQSVGEDDQGVPRSDRSAARSTEKR